MALGGFLHDSPKFTACVAKLYAYGRGENSEDVGAATIKTAYKSFTDSGYRLKALLKGMATSLNSMPLPRHLSKQHPRPRSRPNNRRQS